MIFTGDHIPARLLLMYGQKGVFFKGFAAGAQRTQRNVFNIPLTINETYPVKALMGPSQRETLRVI
jgi:hypothetical protein